MRTVATHQPCLHAKIPTRWCGQQPTEKQVLGSTHHQVSAEGNKCERTTGYPTPFAWSKQNSHLYTHRPPAYFSPVRMTWMWKRFEVKQTRLCTFYSQLTAMCKHWFGDTSSSIFSLLGLPLLTNWSVWDHYGSLYWSKPPSMQSMRDDVAFSHKSEKIEKKKLFSCEKSCVSLFLEYHAPGSINPSDPSI